MRNLPFGRVGRVRRDDLHAVLTNPPGHAVFMNRWDEVADGESGRDFLKAIAFRVERGGAGQLLANLDVDRYISAGVVVIAICSDEADAWDLDDWLQNQPSDVSLAIPDLGARLW